MGPLDIVHRSEYRSRPGRGLELVMEVIMELPTAAIPDAHHLPPCHAR